MNIIIKHLSFEDIWNKMIAEHHAHAEEVASGTYSMPFNPCYDTYKSLFDNGNLLSLMAFDGDKPVAYINLISSTVPHSKDFVVASADSFYCRKEYRGKRVMQKLIKMAEDMCREAGIHSISLNTMYNYARAGKYVELLGYTPAEVTYTKVL